MSGIVAFVNLIDRMNEHVGRSVAWLTLLMVLITFVVVTLRYVYAIGWVWLHGIVFMLGAGHFVSIQIFCLVLIAIFPATVTFLPKLLFN